MTGAGKTTAARLLSEYVTRVAVIGMDKVKRFISDFKRCEKDNAIAKDLVFSMTKIYFDHNISVIVEQPFKSEKELKKYEILAKRYKIPIYKIQLFADPQLAFKRVLNRQKNCEDPAPKERIKRNISLFRKKKDKDFVTIDTSNITSQQVAKDILKLLK